MQYDALSLIPPDLRLRIMETQLAWELGWTFEYIEKLPFYRFADLIAFKRGEQMVKK